jgi:hypothetical protein
MTYQMITLNEKKHYKTIWCTFYADQWQEIRDYFKKSLHPEEYWVFEVETGRAVPFLRVMDRDG